MQKTFATQLNLFVSVTDMEYPSIHSLDHTEALLDWSSIEQVWSSIYSSHTGRPGYPLLTFFLSLLPGIWGIIRQARNVFEQWLDAENFDSDGVQ